MNRLTRAQKILLYFVILIILALGSILLYKMLGG